MLVEQNILWFDVSVGDVHIVQVSDCIQDLLEDQLGLLLWQISLCFTFYVLIQGIAASVLHDQIYLHYNAKVLSSMFRSNHVAWWYLGDLNSSKCLFISECCELTRQLAMTYRIFSLLSFFCCSNPPHSGLMRGLPFPNLGKIECPGTIFSTFSPTICQAFRCISFILTF